MANIEKTAQNLQKHGFEAAIFKTALDAKAAALELIDGGSVGFGGSVTIRDLGIFDELKVRGNPVYWHWMAAKEDVSATLEDARKADFYLCSANAVTESGAIINIDGNGNRVAATISGPRTILMIVGQNKIAEGYDQAIARIKSQACGPNARRLGLKTPCAIDNVCRDCDSESRLCRAILSLERLPMGGQKRMLVYLVQEDLGY